MQALILAGGLGTRLRSVVGDRPKPMADVGGRPFLAYLLALLRQHHITDVVLCVGYRAEAIQTCFGDGTGCGVRIRYAVEERLLGTGGAVKNAERFINGTFLVLNGDSYLDTDLGRLIQFHSAKVAQYPETLGTLALTRVRDASRYGSVRMDPQDRLLEFVEKVGQANGETLINGGIYILEPPILAHIPRGKAVSIEREIFPALLKENKLLFGYRAEGFFVDIGTPEGYALFREWTLRQTWEHVAP